MDSSECSRTHGFIRKDQGLASLALMESGGTHNQNVFPQRPLCFPRRISLRNLSSSPSPSSSSCSSPMSARFEDHNQPNLLDACFLCKKSVGGNKDIFIPRRDFCSQECRREQLDIDKSNSLSSSMKAEQGEVREDLQPSGKLETPFPPRKVHQDHDENQTKPPKPLSIEDGNSSVRIDKYTSVMLPKEILERSSLQDLYLFDCIALKIFPLPPSLKRLLVYNCRALEFPQCYEPMNRLENLTLRGSCDSLQTFPLNYFPKLVSLRLGNCRNLEYLSIDKKLHNELTSLEFLEISDCPKLRFPEDGFQAPNLNSLGIYNCLSLTSLQWILCFESLRTLFIVKCPALESFPMEGLPSSLLALSISFCDKMIPHKGWKLDKLHSLSRFQIEGGCKELESFPEEGLLPTNLKSLSISGLLNLISLDGEGLQKLTSLHSLGIDSCSKLDSLPEHGLPSSLFKVSITYCSLLNPKLRNRKGKEWSKIAHIHSIHLDEGLSLVLFTNRRHTAEKGRLKGRKLSSH